MFLYELKSEKKNWIYICIEVLVFFLIGYILKRFPEIVVNFIKFINESEIILDIFGEKNQIKSVTYKEIMFFILVLYLPILQFRNGVSIAGSLYRDERLGNLKFFFMQQVTRTRLLLCKFAVALLELLVEYTLLGAVIWRFSLVGVNHTVLHDLVTEEVVTVMKMVVAVGSLIMCVSFIYGCTTKKNNIYGMTFNLLFIGYLMAVFPNIIKAVTNVENVEKMYGFLCKIRKINLLYLCQPFVSVKGSNESFFICMGISVLFVIVGVFFYNRKDII